MNRMLKTTFAATLAFGVAACSNDVTSNDDASLFSLNAAFESTPGGFSNLYSSFASADSFGFVPGMGHGDRDRDRMGMGMGMGMGMNGHRGGGMMHGNMMLSGGMGLMGGGLHDLFRGFGFGMFGHGRFGDPQLGNCAFNAATGRLECTTDSHNGLTITRSVAYATASGAAQQVFDSITTDRINVRVSVTGTHTRRDNATTTVSHTSDRTVSGLAQGSTKRTVNGTSAGSENTTGTNSDGAFTASRIMGDTVTNVVVPVAAGTATPAYPMSGTVVRSAKVSVTRAGQTTTSTRREVVTYDGSSTATVTITQDGTTKSCTLPLPHGRLSCS